MAARRRGRYFVCDVPRDLPDRQRWPELKAIGWAISDTIRDGKDCQRRAVLHPEQEALGAARSPPRFAATGRSKIDCIGNSM